jgi:hypothetical protein
MELFVVSQHLYSKSLIAGGAISSR